MANLAGVVQQLRKERDQMAKTVRELDAALAALGGGSRRRAGNRSPLSAAARERIARRREHGGQRCELPADGNRTLFRCPRRRRRQPPLAGRSPQPRKRDAQRSKPLRRSQRNHGLLESQPNMAAKSHDHICAECGAIYACPEPTGCPCTTAEQRIGLCPGCEPRDGVEIIARSEDGFEAIIRPSGRRHFRIQ
jgi:hypothetical protein